MGMGYPVAFGALMRQPPLTLEDQARTNTQVVRPPPAHGAMTWRGGHIRIHAAFHIPGLGRER